MRVLNFLILLVIGLATWSCVDEVLCTKQYTNGVQVKFLSKSTGVDSVVSVAKIDAQFSNDSFPDISDTTSAVFSLPINPNSETTRFIFTFSNDSIKDLSLFYQVRTRIIAIDCPPEIAYTLEDTVAGSFDSTMITNTEVRLDTENNIQIYL